MINRVYGSFSIETSRPSVRLLGLIFAFVLMPMSIFAYPWALDATFGSGGIVLTNPSTADDEILAIAVQADNKTVAVGYSEFPQQFIVSRYNLDGTLDSSFGVGGIVKTAFGGASFARAVMIQPDGKILVGGDSNQTFTLTRYTTSGELDTTFGNLGKVITPIGNVSYVSGVTVQSDGKIVAVGVTEALGDFAVARYTSAGVLDTGFGTNGIVITDLFGDDDRATSVKLQSDGKIVVGGSSVDFDLFTNFAVVRYDTDGTLDSSFNGTGIATSVMDCGVQAIGILPDGKIVAAGSLDDILLTRFTAAGAVDTSFGTGGVVTTDVGGAPDSAFALTVDDSTGEIYVAGSTVSTGNGDFFLANYLSSGVLDATFDNGDGILVTSLNSSSDIGYSVSFAPNGRIVVGGSQGVSGAKQFGIARYASFAPTSAPVSVSGRVTDHFGRGIRAYVTLTDVNGNVMITSTNTFGYFNFPSVEIGTVVLSPSSSRYPNGFTPSALVLNLMDNYSGANFVAN